jgi:hypothetical protein
MVVGTRNVDPTKEHQIGDDWRILVIATGAMPKNFLDALNITGASKKSKRVVCPDYGGEGSARNDGGVGILD